MTKIKIWTSKIKREDRRLKKTDILCKRRAYTHALLLYIMSSPLIMSTPILFSIPTTLHLEHILPFALDYL
jgi:hypothetical protein